ncbi:MAG: isopentenyl-diphosphate delta-isomerase, partial [Saprospiraceae bacterium]|nr:isopentenyl-diphosphate delta-isomerase [Saprospiraceae bacterium]
MTKQETGTAQRKKDHINLAFDAKVGRDQVDDRFYYEPMLHAHPHEEILDKSFLGKTLQTPIWISSMTGGTEKGQVINENLARACRDFGMGMGLGSCRSLLYSDEH